MICTVIMPTYNQSRFICRAIDSLLTQTLEDWELWVIDDGSPDDTAERVAPYMSDARIHYHRFNQNRGIGTALNFGLDHAGSDLIAYLPSDDVIYTDHLASLAECLHRNIQSVLAYSAIRRNYNRASYGQIEGFALQPVQVMHRKTSDRWIERSELVTDDYERMYWGFLRNYGSFEYSGKLTSEWVDHPHQRHKILREPVGGLNTYRSYFKVKEPIRIHTTVGNHFDEREHYRRFRNQPPERSPDGLKILLVGELAYNPERIVAFEEAGHQLYGLWMPNPYWYNTVGPLPFGNVIDLPLNDWQDTVRNIQPDIIYALLNWQAVPFVHHVLLNNPGIPFVWHYKEGPFISLEKGHWNELIDIHRLSDGQIFTSTEMRDWYETVIPGMVSGGMTMVLDGDLPKRDWLEGAPSPRLSSQDGEIHTVVPGRPIGHHPQDVADLANLGIHLHFYGDFTHGQWREWIAKTLRMAPQHIHLHSQVDQEGWVSEFSRYDAGWLHVFESANKGDLRRANWDDLNIPARLTTLIAAGLPVLQFDNTGSQVATQSLVREHDIGLFFRDKPGLKAQLTDETLMDQLRANVWRSREVFTFDHHVERLVSFFHKVIRTRAHKSSAGRTPHRQPESTTNISDRTLQETV